MSTEESRNAPGRLYEEVLRSLALLSANKQHAC
jgi:hypothetical protein